MSNRYEPRPAGLLERDMKQDDGAPVRAAFVEQVEFGRWSYPDNADPVRIPEAGLALTFTGRMYDTHVVVPLDVARPLLVQLRAALDDADLAKQKLKGAR